VTKMHGVVLDITSSLC